MNVKRIDVLGTEYTVEMRKVSEDECLKSRQLSGYCSEESKAIVIADMSETEYFPGMSEHEQEEYRKKVLRHELTHAFLNESGLSESAGVPQGGWAKHEEMVDWFAIQSPKMFRTFRDAGCL